MKQWSNFYFWSSWILLFCLFSLIFHLYQSSFNLISEESIEMISTHVIDVKTILTVLGTIFGAYFGAKTAGKYAILSVEKQIDAQEKKDKAKEDEMMKSILSLHSTYLGTLEVIGVKLLEDFKITETNKFEDKNTEYLKGLKLEIENCLVRLNTIDTSKIYTENPSFFLLPIYLIENLVDSVKRMINNIESSNEKKYKEQYNRVQEDFDDIAKHKEKINMVLSLSK